MLSVTKSFLRSGSSTVDNAFITSDSLYAIILYT
jgi:hypothetical protein